MKNVKRWTWVTSLFAGLLVAGCSETSTPPTSGGSGGDLSPSGTSESSVDEAFDRAETLSDLESWAGRGVTPFADAEVFFEFNSTDNDLGFQLFLDAEGWRRVNVFGPDRHRVVDFRGRGPLKELGLTELRFESAEPSPAEVLALFDPGDYVFVGVTTDGRRLVGEGELSHDLPPAAVFVHPLDGETVSPENLIMEWNPVPGLDGYEIIVGSESSGNSLSLELDGDASSVSMPNEFMKAGAEYKAEVLTIAENGNKTITELVFFTN